MVEAVLGRRVLVRGKLAALRLGGSGDGDEAQHDELAEHVCGGCERARSYTALAAVRASVKEVGLIG